MNCEKKQLLYCDTGVLSRIRATFRSEIDTQLIYSDAHIADLKNSSKPELELQFLKEQEALYIKHVDTQTILSPRDPFEIFAIGSDFAEEEIAPLLSFFSGGGPDQTAQEAATTIVDMLTESEPLLHGQINTKIECTGLTNRDIERGLDKVKQETNRSGGLQDYLDTLPAELRSKIKKSFPQTSPAFQDIIGLAMFVGIMGWGTSKGVRKRSEQKSHKTSRHDWIDNYHIAYGLHCYAFASNDNAALERARHLNDYWKLNRKLYYYDKTSGFEPY